MVPLVSTTTTPCVSYIGDYVIHHGKWWSTSGSLNGPKRAPKPFVARHAREATGFGVPGPIRGRLNTPFEGVSDHFLTGNHYSLRNGV